MAGIRTGNMIYDVGNYCRLSKDDGTDKLRDYERFIKAWEKLP